MSNTNDTTPETPTRRLKISKRETPKDELSFQHEDHSVHVFTHRNSVVIRVMKGGTEVHGQIMNPDQFISLLMRDAR